MTDANNTNKPCVVGNMGDCKLVDKMIDKIKSYGIINLICLLNSKTNGSNKHSGEKRYLATGSTFQKKGIFFSPKVFRSGRRHSLKKIDGRFIRAEQPSFLDSFFLSAAIEMIALIVDILNVFCKLHYPHKVLFSSLYVYLKKEKEAGLFNKYIYITKEDYV